MAKQLYPNIVRGGMAIPLGNNYYFMKGRKHNQGGIDIGKDLEVEGGEIMKLDENNVKVFSAVPFLNGRSPVEKILGGENPNKVFAQQERFKKVNKINDDGTKAKYGKRKINTETIPESEQYAVTTPDGQRKVFNNKVEAQQYITANTPKGYSLYDTTNYGSNIDKGQTAILDRNTEREIEKATEKEIRTNARKANIESNKEYAMEALNAMPIIGDGMDIYSIVKDAYNKNYGNAALTAGMMLVPFDKLLKPVGKGIKRLFTKANKKSNVKFTDNFDINKNNKSYEELAEEYTDSWFDLGIKSSKDINAKNLQNITDDEWDKLYNKAIKNNDVEETQRLRDLHFKAKAFNSKTIDNYGLPIHNYHGGQKGINVFFNSKDNLNYKNTKHQGYLHPKTRIGIYFSPDKEIAKNYKRTYGKKGEIYDTYLKMDNPYIQKYSTTLLNRVKNLLFRDKYFDPAVIRDYRLNKELKGFDGVSHGDFENVVWDNKNIKLADPITYDDNSNIIPLSKRDDFTNPDIRYSWLLPTIGATTGLSLINNNQNVKRFGGKINKFRNGGDVTPEEEALWKANNTVKPASNYHAAKDMNITKTREDFTDFVQRNFPNCPTGLSNCTLTASQFYGKPIGRASTIVNNPKENNFYQVGEEHAIPGTMVIASDPIGTVDPKYHTMILSGYADRDYPFEYNGIKYNIKKGEPLVTYSKGKNTKIDYKKNIPLKVYNDQGEGKTYNRYYRPYDKNGLPNVLLPELIVTNKKVMGGIEYIYDKINKSDKNFAKRLRDKNRKHIINWEDTTQISTHKLGVATDNKGNHYIYPEVQEVNGRLVDYTRPPFNRTAGMIHAEKTGDTVRVNSIEDGVKFTQEYKNRYMNKKQLGGKANIYRLDSNGKSGLRMNISTGDETKARKKALLGTEDPYLSINDSYRHFVDRSKFMEEWRKRNMLYANNPIGDKPDVNKLAKEIVTKPSNAIFIEAPKDIKINYSQGLKDYAKNATTIKPSINWNKIGTAIKPYAGSIIDTVGNIATSLINASTLNKMKYTKQPIPQIANKLKTSVNINPQLKTLNESYNQYTDYINNNTASSKVAREALQRARIKNVLDTNTLYATKENTETELINKDRINQQTVANANVDNYNKWLAGKAEFDNAILDKKSENIVGAINNITSSFNTSINNIKKDRQFNNNLISVLAANPNVNPEYLRALGADWVTDKMIEDWKLANKKK